MKPKLSICVFIRDNNSGAFGLWESMHQLMPFADEFFVLDLGSTDGTLEILKDLTKNKKIRLEEGEFPVNPVTNLIDAGSFAELPNAMIPTCKNDLVMYYQADEIFHDNLLEMLERRLDNLKNFDGLSFWRYQLQDNFQKIKWFPHIVHRIDYKERFTFIDDGMNTNRTNDAELLSGFNGSWFTRWGAEYSLGRLEPVDENRNPYIYGNKYIEIKTGKYAREMPTHEMILDIGKTGGFLENVIAKNRLHAPLWRSDPESISIGGIMHNLTQWHNDQKRNPDWTRETTPFNIPKVLRGLLGQTTYPVRKDIVDAIKRL